MDDSYQHTFADRHFLGRLSEELSDLIAQQSSELLLASGIVIPPKSCSLMVAIDHHGPCSVRVLANALERSHQLVSQKLPKLVDLGLIESSDNPHDRRERQYALTENGQQQMARFHALQPRLERVYGELFEEIGDVAKLLNAAIGALHQSSLADRSEALAVSSA